MRKFAPALILFLAVVLLSAAVFFTGITLADGWILWTVFIVAALGIAIPACTVWQRITGTRSFIWNYLFGAVVIAAVLSSAFYMSNYFFSYSGSKHTVEAVVVRKYSREQSRRRTVGRRVIYTSDKMYTYHVVCRFENGLEKEKPVPVSKYLKTRVGHKIVYNVEPGLFGIPVIKHQN